MRLKNPKREKKKSIPQQQHKSNFVPSFSLPFPLSGLFPSTTLLRKKKNKPKKIKLQPAK
jgi:hypothetical protein